MPDPPDMTELPYQLKSLLHTYATQLRHVFTTGVSRSKLLEAMDGFKSCITVNRPALFIVSEAERLQKREAERAVREGSETEPVNVDSEADTTARTGTLTDLNRGRTSTSGHISTRGYRFRLEEIRDINKSYNTSNIPGETEPKALEQLDKLSVRNFKPTLRDFQNNLEILVQQEIIASVSEAFVHNQHLALYNELQAITRTHLEEILHNNELALKAFCAAETLHPFTLDKEKFDNAKEKYIAKHREARLDARITVAKALRTASDLSRGKKKGKAIDESEIRATPDE